MIGARTPHRSLAAVLAAALAAASGCADARRLADAVAPCARCHGAPPATGAHLVHASSAWNAAYGALHVLEDVAPAGGPSYEFGCGHCHPLDPAQHWAHVAPAVGDVPMPDVVLEPSGAPAASLKGRNEPGAAYDPATRTCSGVYCHSSGQDPAAIATVDHRTTPAWDAAPGSLGCGGCHGNPPRYPSGGAGAPDANSHLDLAYDGWEGGHFAGMPGPWHGGGSKHGGESPSFPYDTYQAAAPITCQTCHAETVDPASVAPGGFFWLDTTGDYHLPGGDPEREPGGGAYSVWRTGQCVSCHISGGAAPVLAGRVLPLRHVNGRRDVVFDVRPALTAGLAASLPPIAPPFRPYFVTYFTPSMPGAEAPVDAELVSTSGAGKPVFTTTLDHAEYDPATKTCSNVGCHLAYQSLVDAGTVEPLRWGAPKNPHCTGCHSY